VVPQYSLLLKILDRIFFAGKTAARARYADTEVSLFSGRADGFLRNTL
jgi:hypothetical protein